MRAHTPRLALTLAIWLVAPALASDPPKNVILLIGDGMGFEHVKAAGMYQTGVAGSLPFESFPYTGQVTTHSASSSVTDSAAGATAMATGHKVNNGVISIARPGDDRELETLLEYSRDRGKRTGLVTSTYMTHATPAAFGAHEPSRYNYSQIAGDYLNQSRPNVLLGGGANGLYPTAATNAGYDVVTARATMQALDPNAASMVSGQFGTTHMPYEYDYMLGGNDGYDTLPHLSEMTGAALDILDADADGFFLMVEGGRIDHASHDRHIRRAIHETLEFANAVQAAIDWAQGRDDTLILVTADHETGGLAVTLNLGQGQYPRIRWATNDHTSANVPIYAWGVNADLVSGTLDNTDIWDIVTIPEPSTALLLALVVVFRRARDLRGPR